MNWSRGDDHAGCSRGSQSQGARPPKNLFESGLSAIRLSSANRSTVAQSQEGDCAIGLACCATRAKKRLTDRLIVNFAWLARRLWRANERRWPAMKGTARNPPKPKEIAMKWTTPSYTDMRFGFEITMYIATR